jgi:hypothetical protein
MSDPDAICEQLEEANIKQACREIWNTDGVPLCIYTRHALTQVIGDKYFIMLGDQTMLVKIEGFSSEKEPYFIANLRDAIKMTETKNFTALDPDDSFLSNHELIDCFFIKPNSNIYNLRFGQTRLKERIHVPYEDIKNLQEKVNKLIPKEDRNRLDHYKFNILSKTDQIYEAQILYNGYNYDGMYVRRLTKPFKFKWHEIDFLNLRTIMNFVLSEEEYNKYFTDE